MRRPRGESNLFLKVVTVVLRSGMASKCQVGETWEEASRPFISTPPPFRHLLPPPSAPRHIPRILALARVEAKATRAQTMPFRN
jgi:hypothetical protein